MALEVNIKKNFKKFTLDVSFESDNDTIGILGRSGSGKSLTLKCISGLEDPDEGKIVFNGKVFFDSERKINLPPRERKIGFLFQNYALFPHMTVEENISFGIKKMNKNEKIDKVKKYLKNIRLDDMGKRYPSQLSGGQQQRVAIARAMIVEPDIFLLDEPFSALDQHLRYQMEMQLKETLENFSGTTVFVSHDINETYRISDKILIYNKGKIVDEGEKDKVFMNPKTIESAKITGCKNVKKACHKKENIYTVPSLGITLEGPFEKKNIQYIGIRSHNILWAKGENKEKNNIFRCNIIQLIESPFEVSLILALKNGEETLRWEISKELWKEIHHFDNDIYINIPKEKIILI